MKSKAKRYVVPADVAKEVARHRRLARGETQGTHTLVPMGKVNTTVDRNDPIFPVVFYATDKAGQPVVGQWVHLTIDDPDQTGTAFFAEGISTPFNESFGLTYGGGYGGPFDSLESGSRPGTVTVTLRAADDEGGEGMRAAKAAFTLKVSDKTPHRVEVVQQPSPDLPAGTMVALGLTMRVLGTDDQPIPHGVLYFEIYDPHGTGSVITSAGIVAAWVGVPVSDEGEAHFFEAVWVGDEAPGKPFYMRVSRRRNSLPSIDVRYIAVPPDGKAT
jgi:hypothetical protein